MDNVRKTQSSFSRGEIAPALYGRIDQEAYYIALKTAYNVIVRQFGGAYNRGGQLYLAPVKDHTKPPRLIEFQFKTQDVHQLEIGHEYIRILREGGHVTETAKAITGVTKADPAVVTCVGHGYTTGDEVFLSDIGGMVELNQERFTITVLSSDTFSLRDQVDGTNINSTTYTTYTSGGTAARIYTVTTPYQQADLRNIKFSQTADVITFTCAGYNAKELKRLALDNWQLSDLAYIPEHPAPGTLAATADTTGSEEVKYTVTAVDSVTNEESLTATGATASQTILGVTKANPAVVTISADADLATGDEIEIAAVGGMTELNGRRFKIVRLTTTTFSLQDEDSSDYTTYTSGGTFKRCFARVTDSSTSFRNTITWAPVSGSSRYLVYRGRNGAYAFIGDTENTSFTDSSAIISNSQLTPPFLRNPFRGDGKAPTAVGFHEQRRVLGGSVAEPDTKYYSRISSFNNFSRSSPQRSDDSFRATLPSGRINDIRHFVSLNDLLVFTSGAEWRVSSNGAFTITNIEQKPQTTWGCSQLPPIVAGSTAVFYTGTSVRTLKFAFNSDGYESKEVSLWSPHLLENRSLVEWAYMARNTDPVIYVVGDDGKLVVLTFNEDQEVQGWTLCATKGDYESVCVSKAAIDSKFQSAFFVVKRTVNGRTVRYIERTQPEPYTAVEDCFYVDSGLTLDVPYDITGVTNADPAVVTITGHPFLDGDEIDITGVVWTPTGDTKGNETYPVYLNNLRFTVANATTNTLTLIDEDGNTVDSTEYGAYISGGEARKAVDTVSGLKHLAGETVVALANGNVVRDLVVSATGTVTFSRKFSKIHIGLSYISDVELLDIEIPERTIQGKPMRAYEASVRFERSRGLLIGPDKNNLTEMAQREYEKMGEPTRLLTGVKTITLVPEWNSNGRVLLRQVDPLPMNILGVTLEFEVGI